MLHFDKKTTPLFYQLVQQTNPVTLPPHPAMYNGIGLTTVRGTGTSGYVQTNRAYVRPNRRSNGRGRGRGTGTGTGGGGRRRNGTGRARIVSSALEEHEALRRVEVAVAELDEDLSERGYDAAARNEMTNQLRSNLLARQGEERAAIVDRDLNAKMVTPASSDVMSRRDAHLTRVFGIRPDRKDRRQKDKDKDKDDREKDDIVKEQRRIGYGEAGRKMSENDNQQAGEIEGEKKREDGDDGDVASNVDGKNDGGVIGGGTGMSVYRQMISSAMLEEQEDATRQEASEETPKLIGYDPDIGHDPDIHRDRRSSPSSAGRPTSRSPPPSPLSPPLSRGDSNIVQPQTDSAAQQPGPKSDEKLWPVRQSGLSPPTATDTSRGTAAQYKAGATTELRVLSMSESAAMARKTQSKAVEDGSGIATGQLDLDGGQAQLQTQVQAAPRPKLRKSRWDIRK